MILNFNHQAKGRNKICELKSGLRFIVREDKPANESITYKLIFETDDIDPLEFQSNDKGTIRWLETLRTKICILDY